MNLRLPNRQSRATVGLDIDGGFVAAVEARPGEILSAVSADLPEGAVANGEILDADTLAGVLKELFGRHGLPRSVRLGLANQQLVVRRLELPHIKDAEQLDAAVRFQAADAIAMPLDEAVLDYRVSQVVAGPDGGERMHLILVAARRSMVTQLSGAARSAGLKPVGIDLDAFALVRALSVPSVNDTDARILCHLGGVASLAIAVGSSCLLTRTLSGAFGGPVEDTAASLAGEIGLSLDYYTSQPGAAPVREVLLSGPESRAEGLPEQLSSALGLSVTAASPLGSLDTSGLPESEDPFRHTIAAGLALEEAA